MGAFNPLEDFPMQYPKALEAHRARMRAAGFKRLSCEIHPDLSELIERERRPGECQGRCLERLLLGEARPRPVFDRAEFGEGEPKQASRAGEWKAAWQAQQAERIRAEEERKAAAKAARQAEAANRWSACRAQARAMLGVA
jgi:hypothetical protein